MASHREVTQVEVAMYHQLGVAARSARAGDNAYRREGSHAEPLDYD